MNIIFDWVCKFFDSNFLQTVFIVILGFFTYKISKLQQESADTVELHAYLAMEGSDNGSLKPFVRIQNVGTRLVYLSSYIFNGRKYVLSKQVLPSVYSGALANFYWVELPTNGETHVFLEFFFSDNRNKNYSSEVIAENINGFWNVSTSPSKLIK